MVGCGGLSGVKNLMIFLNETTENLELNATLKAIVSKGTENN